MGFPQFFEKTNGSIHFITGIYPHGVSFLTPIHIRVPSLIFGPLVGKYLAENGVSGTFWKNYWLNSFHHFISFCVFSIDFAIMWQNFDIFANFLHKLLRYFKYHDTIVGKMMPRFFWNKVFLKNSHQCSTRLQNRNLYWIFLDEVGSHQSGGILSPFMGTACLSWCVNFILVEISKATTKFSWIQIVV